MKPLLRCLDTGDEAWKDELQEGFAVLENAYPPDAEDELRWYKHLLWEIGALIHTRKSELERHSGHGNLTVRFVETI